MIPFMSQLAILLSVGIAMLLGGILGFERETANRPAGFRTHTLVAGSSALLVELAYVLVDSFGQSAYTEVLRLDPFRIVGAIVTGMGFIGAGAIFRRREGGHIEGLTTAASMLMASSIGITVALKQYVVAVGVTLISLIVLRTLKLVERRKDAR